MNMLSTLWSHKWYLHTLLSECAKCLHTAKSFRSSFKTQCRGKHLGKSPNDFLMVQGMDYEWGINITFLTFNCCALRPCGLCCSWSRNRQQVTFFTDVAFDDSSSQQQQQNPPVTWWHTYKNSFICLHSIRCLCSCALWISNSLCHLDLHLHSTHNIYGAFLMPKFLSKLQWRGRGSGSRRDIAEIVKTDYINYQLRQILLFCDVSGGINISYIMRIPFYCYLICMKARWICDGRVPNDTRLGTGPHPGGWGSLFWKIEKKKKPKQNYYIKKIKTKQRGCCTQWWKNNYNKYIL